jgi:hypothetical protein
MHLGDVLEAVRLMRAACSASMMGEFAGLVFGACATGMSKETMYWAMPFVVKGQGLFVKKMQ